MRFKHFVTAASIALLPIAASAAQIVIPAAGSSPGVGGSQWQSELTLHNTSARDITLSMTYHQGTEVSVPVSVTVAARATTSIADVINSRFGKGGTGAIVIDVANTDTNKLAVNSRTFNLSATGEFGQDIPAVRATDAAVAGDVVVLAAPSSASSTRFNFGIYAVEATNVRWQLIRANGTVAATVDAAYTAGMHAQYNNGIKALLGSNNADNDTVHATITSGRAIFYGSAVNNVTGDPQFVPGIRTHEEIRINFAGIDIDKDGTVDVADADKDGVLDVRVDMFTSTFPNYFRVVASGENGEPVTYQIVFSDADVQLIDTLGMVQLAPGGNLKGKTGELRIRATAEDGTTAILVIPINYV